MRFVQNFGWRTGLYELVHDFAAQVTRVAYLAPQLTI